MTPVEQIELVLLDVMVEDTPAEYLYGYYFPFRHFTLRTTMDREVIRGFMRSMRDRGLVQYGSGFSEDGETAGGGYTLVPAGAAYHKTLVRRAAAAVAYKRAFPNSNR